MRGPLPVRAERTTPEARPSQRLEPARRPWRRRAWMAAPVLVLGLVALFSWWLNPTWDAIGDAPIVAPSGPGPTAALEESAPLAWPESSLTGGEAKVQLLKFLHAAEERLMASPGYTATFVRQERMDGKLGPVQTSKMKLRHRPFAVYLKFVEPEAGKEVIYAEGYFDGKVVAHPGGAIGRLLAPRLSFKPDSALALSDNRHPVTDAGLLNLTRRLIGFRKLDLEDEAAETVLDRVTTPEGRELLRSLHRHKHYHPRRPFAWVEVRYDPETFVPVRIESHDWVVKDEHAGAVADETCPLAELYQYNDLVLDAPLGNIDFDPTNPAYEFSRF